MQGRFITFEGIDGSGKTTQIQKVTAWMQAQGLNVEVTREPGGTPLGDHIRALLLSEKHLQIESRAEVLLYAASRAQHVAERILPALREGRWVLCDRFTDASIAYQSFGLNVSLEWVKQINHFATGGLTPHRTYLFDLPVSESRHRMNQRLQSVEGERGLDRIEKREGSYYQKVREGFLQIAQEQGDRVRIIDATQTVEGVFAQIVQDLQKLLP